MKFPFLIVVLCLRIQRSGISAAQVPPDSNLDAQTLAYFQSIGNFEDFANSVMKDGESQQSVTTELPTVENTSTPGTGLQNFREVF